MIEIYKVSYHSAGSLRSEWHWRARARNGRIVCHSTQGYRTPGKAESGVVIARRVIHTSAIKVVR